MKLLNSILLASTVFFFTNCKKDNTTQPEPESHSIILQPGLNNGQDTHVAKVDNVSTDGNANLNHTNELVMARWNTQWGLASYRSFLKFTDLNTIPSNAQITSAFLHLYGNASSTSFPSVGNTAYPGSPYQENSSTIQRVIGGDWDESTLTWNNQPTTTNLEQANILASTSQFNYNTVVDVTAMVQQMVSNPSTNFGFCIKLVNETAASRVLIFGTSESEVSRRPKLVIEAKY